MLYKFLYLNLFKQQISPVNDFLFVKIEDCSGNFSTIKSKPDQEKLLSLDLNSNITHHIEKTPQSFFSLELYNDAFPQLIALQ